MRISVDEDPLDKIVAELIGADLLVLALVKTIRRVEALTVNQWHARIGCRGARGDSFEIALKELVATNLEKFLNDLGCILIHAVLGGLGQNGIDGGHGVVRIAVLTDVLNAPITKLTFGDFINS